MNKEFKQEINNWIIDFNKRLNKIEDDIQILTDIAESQFKSNRLMYVRLLDLESNLKTLQHIQFTVLKQDGGNKP